jgi:hypothetical protein
MHRCIDEPNSPLNNNSKKQYQKEQYKTCDLGALHFVLFVLRRLWNIYGWHVLKIPLIGPLIPLGNEFIFGI